MLPLDHYIEEFNRALTREVDHQKEVGGHPYQIHDGRRLLYDRDSWIYMFTLDHEVSLPDGAPVRVEIGRQAKATGEVIGLDNFDLILSLDRDLGEEIPEANLYCEPWELLVALQERLQEIQSRNAALATAILTGTPIALGPRQARRNKRSGAADPLGFVLDNAVAFVWGPPGTGKTETLARITAELWAKGERVLILSHSNVAVDEAVERTYGRVDSFPEGKLVRYGFAQLKFLDRYRHLTSFYLAAKIRPELMRRYEQLLAEREALRRSGRSAALARLEKELSNCRREIRATESLVIEAAEVVGTTLSKAVVDEAVFRHHWDTVIVDEASMAFIPHVVYAASLAARRIVAVGDFRQLAPIALAPDDPLVDRWLRRDIFEEAGIVKTVEEGGSHPCLTMLDVQHRMHPRIAGFASVRFYGGKLQDAPGMAEKVACIVTAEPFPHEPLIMLDLSELAIGSVILPDSTRFNLVSALACVSVAASAAARKSIAIITPYVAQARLLRALISDLFPKEGNPPTSRCRASTVHRFQGSQAELVILDLVDSSGKPGTLISSSKESSRLINVAVTRAQGKLVVVCKRSYIEGTVSSNMPARWLLNYTREKGAHRRIVEVASSGLLHGMSGQLEWLVDGEEALRRLGKEIAKAKKAKGCVQGEWAADGLGRTLTGELVRSNLDVTMWSDKPSVFKGTPLENRVAAKNFLPFAALLLIDADIVWCGVRAGSADRHLWIRYQGKKGAASVAGLFGLDTRAAKGLRTFIERNQKCPECGRPVTTRVSRKRRGVVFLGCTGYPACSWTNLLEPSVVDDYLLKAGIPCPKCGGMLVARLSSYGVFVGCSNFPECDGRMSIPDLL